MNPDSLGGMEIVRPIGFTDALGRLQRMLGVQVKVEVNEYSRFFGCGFEGVLERVETLPPENTAIRLVLSGGAGFYLDPEEVQTFVGGDFAEAPTWLEFQLKAGPAVAIGPAEDASIEVDDGAR